MRGTRTPCCPYAYWTSPEQSNPLSAVPPQVYGVPSDSRAVCTTSAAVPVIVVGGSGGGRSGGPPLPPVPRPPPLFPSPNDTPIVALIPLRASLRGFQNPLGPRSSRRYRASLPNAIQESARHSTPMPRVHWMASSWVDVSVEMPSAAPASAYGPKVLRP